MKERMPEADVLELPALHPGDDFVEASSSLLGDLRRQRLRHDDGAAVDLVGGVVELRVKRHREIRRNRPGCRRPDQHRHVTSGERRDARRQLARAFWRKRELDVDRWRRVRLVFDLRFGKRRSAMDAPVHRLLALVDQPLLDETPERARDCRLIPVVHRQIRLIPGAENAKPLELLRHRSYEPLGVRAARATELGHAHVALLGPQFLVDLQFDRQAVTVVAHDVRRIEAGHRP